MAWQDPEQIKADRFYEFHDAMADGDFERLELLSKEVADFPTGKDGWLGRHWITTAIHIAREDVLDWVLTKGAPVNFCDDEGYSPLKSLLEMEDQNVGHTFGQAGVLRCIDRLIEAGANMNFPHTLDETALHRAAMISSPKVVRHLLAKGADPFAYDAEYEPRQPVGYAYLSKWSEDVTQILRDAMAGKG